MGAKDVTLMYSVVDLAGVNRVSVRVLGNAAAAMAGMASIPSPVVEDDRPLVAASMFGVTTPAVDAARERLDELGYEVLVFHATGSGGRALESLAQSGLLSGVLDLTTTELADDLVGGVLSAGPDRLTAAGARGVPQVVAPGALDMVNFGPRDTVPESFGDRLLYVHNPTVTLMRTTAEEMGELGRRMAAKLSAANGPAVLFVPRRGVSALDVEGAPFHDPKADESCFDALDEGLRGLGRRGREAGPARQRPRLRPRHGRPAAPDDHREGRRMTRDQVPSTPRSAGPRVTRSPFPAGPRPTGPHRGRGGGAT
ncbi:Tm-1-like ATP-binding domain-containing protein [Streptosporangium vulgare]|uniref:Tm-1-like ATP-binding domain-containing protein n=1 Tax=Streptosporangium vulgare TaxID=46190 RepID=UPI0031D69CE9